MDISVIGLGLIGGSMLRALAAAGRRVVGYDADPGTRAIARTAAARAPEGERWQVVGSVADAVRRRGGRTGHSPVLVVVAVPFPAVGIVFDELAGAGYTGLVTDVTSVKCPIRELAVRHLHASGQALAGYVGGHPMAGRETSGFAAADAGLFRGCAWALCLEPDETALPDWLDLAVLLTSLGARVVPTTAAEHDRAVAVVSHLPHLVAAAIAAQAGQDPLALTLAAGSFRDATRVAGSRPDLVAAMCGGNADAVRPALDELVTELTAVAATLYESDPIDALVPRLAPGYRARCGWPPAPGESAELPADPEVLLRLGRVGGWITDVHDDRRTVTAIRPAR